MLRVHRMMEVPHDPDRLVIEVVEDAVAAVREAIYGGSHVDADAGPGMPAQQGKGLLEAPEIILAHRPAESGDAIFEDFR